MDTGIQAKKSIYQYIFFMFRDLQYIPSVCQQTKHFEYEQGEWWLLMRLYVSEHYTLVFLIPPRVQVTDTERFSSWLFNFNSCCVHDANPCPWLPRAKRVWRKPKETAGVPLVLAVCSEQSMKWDLGACSLWCSAAMYQPLTNQDLGRRHSRRLCLVSADSYDQLDIFSILCLFLGGIVGVSN